MAMEKQFVVRETHNRAITAVGYNPSRREIMLGCEDGVIKTLEADTGRHVNAYSEHKGWVTNFLYWTEMKLMLSSANDGVIVAWGSGGGISDKIVIGQPVYCMTINPRRHQLVCGMSRNIHVYTLDEERECGHVINNKVVYIAQEHTDIVRCIVCHESRVYSAGYDEKMIIYDSSYTGKNTMEPFYINPQAHDAGISCLLLVKDNENNTWIVTGSFDKTVKIWTPDGKPLHRLDGFVGTVTGICYVPKNKTIWVAGGTSTGYLYDPKSGENVSDFIGTFQEQEEEKYHLQSMKYFPELNQVVASTSRRHVIVWKYNPCGCITALKCKTAVESLTYTRKVPILLFSGDHEGIITKWERMQSNHFTYSKEFLLLQEARKAKKKKKTAEEKELEQLNNQQNNTNKTKTITSHYAFNKPSIPPVSVHNHPHTGILKVIFVEELDIILAACEDSNIYVWGFDMAAVEVLKNMKSPDSETLIRKYAILLDQESELLPQNATYKTSEEDSVTNRVAGFVCKYILSEHTSCVTSMAVVGRPEGYQTTYVISAGWDRRLCIWNLEEGILHDVYRSNLRDTSYEHIELACDGIITDLAFCPQRSEFAYASSDKMVYIRKFSTDGTQMTLLNTLQGHYAEITCIKWNPVKHKWVTASEDGTIRIWAADGMNECEQVLSAQGSVTALCVDLVNGAIVAGTQNMIRLFEPEQHRLVQTNVGHTDAIRCILHIPERTQYVSASWDQTIRVWNAWKLPKKKRKESKEKGKMDVKLEQVEITVEMKDPQREDANETVEADDQ